MLLLKWGTNLLRNMQCRRARARTIIADSAFGILNLWWACACIFCIDLWAELPKFTKQSRSGKQEIFLCSCCWRSTRCVIILSSSWSRLYFARIFLRPRRPSTGQLRSWLRSRRDSVCTSSRRYLTPRESIQEASNLQSRWVDGLLAKDTADCDGGAQP